MTSIFSIDRQATVGRSFLKNLLCFTIASLTAIFGLPIQDAIAESPRPTLSVSWRLLDNLPDDRFKSEIELRNDGSHALANDWVLYFNCERKLLTKSVGKDFDLTHVNGDFYVLRPISGTGTLAPGEHRTIPLEGSLWAINISDAPSGFFIVLKEERGQPSKPISLPLEVEPF